MNICLHQEEPKAANPGVPWKCEKCGEPLALTHNNRCKVTGTITFLPEYVMLECPNCRWDNPWYCNKSCITH
jgi:RNase P subunit RPR2